MAETKKTTKKAAPKAEKSLAEQLTEKRQDLLDYRRSHASGELVNPRVLSATKKDIARLLTKLNAEKENK